MMKLFRILFLCCAGLIAACDPDSEEPETGCNLIAIYDLDYHFVTAAKIYDIRKSPPLEIRNGTIEYDLFWQWQRLTDNGDNPWPYNHYFVYSAFFDEPDQSILHFTNVDVFDYEFVRDDCGIDFFRTGDTLHAELIMDGNEITFDRYAIYDHSIAGNGTDTFTFLEFRDKDFKSYKEIVAEFAKDNAGQYDTIGIELVSSRVRE